MTALIKPNTAPSIQNPPPMNCRTASNEMMGGRLIAWGAGIMGER